MDRVFQLFPDIKKAEKWIENNNKEFQLFPRKPPIFQVKSKTLEKIKCNFTKRNGELPYRKRRTNTSQIFEL